MSESTAAETALVVAESAPVLIEPNARDAKHSLQTYLEIQKVFDQQMPDCIMSIRGKQFRKKAYWRAIATAFRVETRLISEERVEIDGDWGYLATYRASTQDGRQCDGDGACMASEKAGPMGTVHNIRAHAHTRAKNRAISDLVGFGEVSADELGPDAYAEAAPPPPRRPAKAAPVKGSTKRASEKQLQMLKAKSYARAEELTGDESDHETAGSIRKAAMTMLGFEKAEDITPAAVDPMVKAIESATLDDDGNVVIDDGEVF